MKLWHPLVADELDGARAFGALFAGNLDGAADALESVSISYVFGVFAGLVL